VETVRVWAGALHRVEPVFPIGALLLFLAGAVLVHRSFAWSDGWVVTAVVGLAAIEVLGGTLLRGAGRRLGAALGTAGDGPVPPPLRAAAMAPDLWLGTHTVTGTALGILYLMSAKPSGLASAVIVVLAGLAGGATALPLLREPAAAQAAGS
jgi:hypothetical protein